jgi:hypothetical protein
MHGAVHRCECGCDCNASGLCAEYMFLCILLLACYRRSVCTWFGSKDALFISSTPGTDSAVLGRADPSGFEKELSSWLRVAFFGTLRARTHGRVYLLIGICVHAFAHSCVHVYVIARVHMFARSHFLFPGFCSLLFVRRSSLFVVSPPPRATRNTHTQSRAGMRVARAQTSELWAEEYGGAEPALWSECRWPRVRIDTYFNMPCHTLPY